MSLPCVCVRACVRFRVCRCLCLDVRRVHVRLCASACVCAYLCVCVSVLPCMFVDRCVCVRCVCAVSICSVHVRAWGLCMRLRVLCVCVRAAGCLAPAH